MPQRSRLVLGCPPLSMHHGLSRDRAEGRNLFRNHGCPKYGKDCAQNTVNQASQSLSEHCHDLPCKILPLACTVTTHYIKFLQTQNYEDSAAQPRRRYVQHQHPASHSSMQRSFRSLFSFSSKERYQCY